jgi:hypothetical protein
VTATCWVLYLDPTAVAKPRTLGEVVERLLTSEAPAVRRVVGKAGPKTLRNRLARYRFALLQPEIGLLVKAEQWAKAARLAALPLETAVDRHSLPGLDVWLDALRDAIVRARQRRGGHILPD